MHRPRQRLGVLATLLASAVVLSGCGSAGGHGPSTTGKTSTTTCPPTAQVPVLNSMPAAHHELVPTGADSVRICYYGTTTPGNGDSLSAQATSRTPQTVTRLSSALDALPLGTNSCPKRYHPAFAGIAALMYFGYSSSATDLVKMGQVNCNNGKLTITSGETTNGYVVRYGLDANVLGQVQTVTKASGASSS